MGLTNKLRKFLTKKKIRKALDSFIFLTTGLEFRLEIWMIKNWNLNTGKQAG